MTGARICAISRQLSSEVQSKLTSDIFNEFLRGRPLDDYWTTQRWFDSDQIEELNNQITEEIITEMFG